MPLEMFASHSDEGKPESWAYIMDEIFIAQHPKLYADITTPKYLKGDLFKKFPKEVTLERSPLT